MADPVLPSRLKQPAVLTSDILFYFLTNEYSKHVESFHVFAFGKGLKAGLTGLK